MNLKLIFKSLFISFLFLNSAVAQNFVINYRLGCEGLVKVSEKMIQDYRARNAEESLKLYYEQIYIYTQAALDTCAGEFTDKIFLDTVYYKVRLCDIQYSIDEIKYSPIPPIEYLECRSQVAKFMLSSL